MINTCSGVKRNCPPKIPTKLYISGYKCVCICAYTHTHTYVYVYIYYRGTRAVWLGIQSKIDFTALLCLYSSGAVQD